MASKSPVKGDAMKSHPVAVIVLLSGLLVAADAPPKDAGKKELEKLQGTWVAVSGEHNGAKAPDAAIKGWKMFVNGNKMTFNPQTDEAQVVFELHPAKTPMEIVFTPLDGPRKGESRRAIYAFENELFKLCWDNDEKSKNDKPPTGFSTKQGDGLWILVARRQKP
jgi:uncharacterized protein (TIGR03067 family)